VHNFLLLGEHVAAHAPLGNGSALPSSDTDGGAAGGTRPKAPRLPRKALRPDADAAEQAAALSGGFGAASGSRWAAEGSADGASWFNLGWQRSAAAMLMLAALLALGERRRRGGALSAAARAVIAPATNRVRDL